MTLVDMKISKKEMKKRNQPLEASSGPGDKAEYPHGLNISLYNDEIKKLKIDLTKHRLDEDVQIIATAQVSRISASNEWGEEKTLGIQIQKIDLAFGGSKDDLDWDTDSGKADKILEKRGIIS